MVEDETVIASVMVGHDGHRGIVYYVATHPDFQRKGLGAAAMRAAEGWLTQRGVWKLNLLVRAENEAVRSFYEKLGYEVEPRLCMARKLIPAAFRIVSVDHRAAFQAPVLRPAPFACGRVTRFLPPQKKLSSTGLIRSATCLPSGRE